MSKQKYLLFLALVVLLMVLGLCGCGQVDVLAPEAETLMVDQAVDTSSADASSDAADDVSTASSGESMEDDGEALVEETETDYCLECHSDQETLMAVADPEEETESENEGEG